MSRNIVVFMILLAFSGLVFSVDVSSCQAITSTGTYDMINDLTGAGVPAGLGSACIVVRSSDVLLDCHGYSIDYNAALPPQARYGIFVNDNSSAKITNITVRNCPNITGYSHHVEIWNTSNSQFSNITIYNSYPENGMYLRYNSTNNQISDINGYDGYSTLTLLQGSNNNVITRVYTEGDTFGINVDTNGNNISDCNTTDSTLWGTEIQGVNNLVTNCHSSGNDIGFINFGDNNVFTDNYAYGNTEDGFSIGGQSNVFTDNLAESNTENGFGVGGVGNSLTDNNATNNGEHGFSIYGVDATVNCLATGNGQSGVNIQGNNNTVTNCDSYSNGAYGYLINGSTNNTLSNSDAYSNTLSGVAITNYYIPPSEGPGSPRPATGNEINNVDSYSNTEHGFYAYRSNASVGLYDNDFIGCNGSINGQNGFHIDSMDSSTLDNNYAADNVRGFYIGNSTDLDLTSNTAERNAEGFYLSTSDYNRITGNDALDNSNIGLMLSNSEYNNATGNNCSSNTNEGIRLFSADHNRLSGNDVTDNNHGIWLSTGSDFTTIFDNDAYSNGNSGIYLFSSEYTNITANRLHDNPDGIEIYWNSNDAQLFDNEIYDNSAYGVQLRDSSKVGLHNDHLYGNGEDLGAAGTSLNLDYTMDGVVFDSDGTYTNYTNISLSDSTNDTYTMDWDNQPAALPFPMVSFNQKFIEIDDTGSADTIEDITWHWNTAELPGFDESMLQLWDYSGTWSLLNGTPDTVNNELSLEDLSSFSTFAILAGGACPAPITSAGTYTLTDDIEGSTNNATPIVGTACIKIASSDVVFDCDGYSITNNGTGGLTHAVVSNGTFTNVTVRNCPNMSDYTRGVYYYQTSDGAILDSSAYNNAQHGFILDSSSNNNVVENSYSEANGFYGFYLSNSDNNNLTDNNAASNQQMGYYIQNSDNNRFVDSIAFNNVFDGFRTTTSSGNTFLNCNATGPVQTIGFHLDQGGSHNLTGCNADQNNIGFFANQSNNNFFINVNGSNNDDGLRMESATGNLVDPSYFCDNNAQGVHLDGANSNTIADSVMCRNGRDGVYLYNSDNNDIFRNEMFANVNDGIGVTSDSDNNDIVNNTAYNQQGGNGISVSQSTSSANNITNNTAYNNDLSGFIAFQSPGNTFADNTAYGNGEAGFNINSADNTVLMDNTAHGHPDVNWGVGLGIRDSNNTVVTNDHYFNNAAPDVVIDGSGIMVTLNNVIIDNDAGNLTNYSNVSVDDMVASAYSLEWVAAPGPDPTYFRSFNGKFLGITNLTSGVSIDWLGMYWLESELEPDYLEPKLRLALYDNGTWLWMNSTPNETNNELSYEAITESTIVGLFEFIGGDDDDGGVGPEDELQISFSSNCNGSVVTITSNGNDIEGASVQVFHKDQLYDVAIGSTNSSGEFGFVGCGIPVKILASKTGYQSADTVKTLVLCSECELGCIEDAECLDNEQCLNNMCQPVDCSCGYVQNHTCNPYECCSDSDCKMLESCVDNKCVEDEGCTTDEECESSEYCNIAEGANSGFCEDVTGLCGMADDHEWVQYECGDEEGCPDCPEGYVCQDNLCEPTRDLEGPESAFVGEEITVNATEGGGVCANCEVQIKLPDGRILNGRTDSNGKLTLPLNLEGPYELTLLKDGEPVETIKVNALPKPVSGEDVPDTQVLDETISLIFLVLLLALLLAGVIVWRRGAGRKK